MTLKSSLLHGVVCFEHVIDTRLAVCIVMLLQRCIDDIHYIDQYPLNTTPRDLFTSSVILVV